MKIGFSGRTSWASSSFLLECDCVAETLQAMNQVSSQMVFVELVEVEIPQFVVADSVGKDVVDGHQDFRGYCYSGTLVTAPGFKAVEFVSQVSALGFRRGVGGLHQSRL